MAQKKYIRISIDEVTFIRYVLLRYYLCDIDIRMILRLLATKLGDIDTAKLEKEK